MAKRWLFVAIGVGALAAVVGLTASREETMLWCRSKLGVASAGSDAFADESRAAMQKMMAGMEIRPTGDVDRDFAALMIAHHQGAIEMAQAELRHGGNELLRRMAQEIVVEQSSEIAAMNVALK
jgi:uncharacterized protein (DUF305 family)